MTLTKGQKQFLDMALSGKNIFLTGKAGTGKSFIIDEFVKRCKKNVAKLGTTGIAATNIGGQTVHSFFGITPFEVYDGRNAKSLTRKKREIIQKTDVVIIDEVSMLRVDVLDAINGTMLLNGCGYLSKKQIIFVGDLKQLPAIQTGKESKMIRDRYKSYLFHDSKCYPYLNVKNIELTEIKRQSDERFITALNAIREGRKDSYFKKFVSKTPNNGVILAPHNSTVDKYNKDELKKLKGELYILQAEISGQINPKDYPVDEEIYVKNGAKIMYCKNDKENGLINGSIGTLKIISGCFYFCNEWDDVLIEKHTFENQKYVIEKIEKEDEEGNVYYVEELKLKKVGEMKQYPIKLAYALSIHKSQGMTFNEVTVDISKRCFAPGQLYVALSRCSTPDELKIII